MKIERVSDNQIKFILTEDDLLERNMHLTELSYGSEKTQELFREIMEHATIECNFHATNDTPLIIEAVPVSKEGIMIIITKVIGNEELDERISYPTPLIERYKKMAQKNDKSELEDNYNIDHLTEKESTVEDILNKKYLNHSIFKFDSFDRVISASVRIADINVSKSMLFKYKTKYYLVLENGGYRNVSLNQEGILREYGEKFSSLELSYSFLVEHGEKIIERNAVNILSSYLG